MADVCDMAEETLQGDIARKITEARRALSREPATHCDDCGEEIPEGRRRLVPGCRTCLSCQVARENGRAYQVR